MTINELVRAVNIVLELVSISACPSVNGDGNDRVTINELVVAVTNALNGCE